eukprot:8390802-Lingulodinium_polyedra.AAC.1
MRRACGCAFSSRAQRVSSAGAPAACRTVCPWCAEVLRQTTLCACRWNSLPWGARRPEPSPPLCLALSK